MNGNNTNVELPEPDRVIAYFVPASKGAYVTEIMELAFRNHPQVTVGAGVLADFPQNVGVLLSDVRPDGNFLPEFEEKEKNIQPMTSKQRARLNRRMLVSAKQRLYKWKKFKFASKTQILKHRESPSLSETIHSHYQTNKMLAQKFGKPTLLIKYPKLPYLVPVGKKFKDIGVPRNVVDFTCNGVFTPDSTEQPPIIRRE
uniref:Uncharacterized protein n=1 Tax=Caenorhabditis japonica TaxID=281687 RepID=A0A8R1HPB4_CAEJA